MSVIVEVVSDVICPWCYIGKRRLEKAIEEFAFSDNVEVRWLPFQLNPTMPKEGITRREYRTRKFGSWERSQQLDAQVAMAGKGEGIDFAFDKVQRTPNTLNAHRLIHLAGQHNCQNTMVEALFSAYFTDGQDLCDSQVLTNIATEAGMDQKTVDVIFSDGADGASFKAAQDLAKRHHVDSVPFFVVNNKLTVSGAQPPEAFLETFLKIVGQ